ncbi:CopD family protein [Nocardioides sp. LHG3406-4]|uniref:CopD family protein n=1 Tax=Nocardioides sp. LHG3406-4 TaxID=2804575 RepID=UPI003CE72C54
MTASIMQAAVVEDFVPPLWRILTKFGFFAGLAAGMGPAVVHLAALRPALRDANTDPRDRAVLRRRSGLVMAWGGVVLLASLYPQLASKTTRATEGMPYGEGLKPSAIWDYLSVSKADDVWIAPGMLTLLQFVMFLISALLLVVLFSPRVRERMDRLALISAAVLFVAQWVLGIPGTLEGQNADTWTANVMSHTHPIAGTAWIGGVVALALLAAVRGALTPAAGLVWAQVWKRFSLVGEICVGAVLVSGLWLGWKSVGGVSQLWETPYGRVLLLKVLLVFTMIGLGAFNEYVLLPRIAQLRAAGEDRPLFRVCLDHFPRVVLVEAVMGLAVLVVIPFLNGSAREQAGGAAEPPATGGIFTAVFVLLAIVMISFYANLKVHERLEQGRPADELVAR